MLFGGEERGGRRAACFYEAKLLGWKANLPEWHHQWKEHCKTGHRKLNPLGDTSLLSTLFNKIIKRIILLFVNCHLHVLTFNEIQTFKNQESNLRASSIQVFYGEWNAVARRSKHYRKWDIYKTNASFGLFLHLPVDTTHISISL